jgi:hypothetical protein
MANADTPYKAELLTQVTINWLIIAFCLWAWIVAALIVLTLWGAVPNFGAVSGTGGGSTAQEINNLMFSNRNELN